MNPEPQLKELLDSWQPEIQNPSDFHSQVWRRIASRQEIASAKSWNGLYFHPALTGAFLAAVLLAAIIGGQWQSKTEAAREYGALQARYISSVDPYANGMDRIAR